MFYILVQILGTDASRNMLRAALIFRAKGKFAKFVGFAWAVLTTGLLGVLSGFVRMIEPSLADPSKESLCCDVRCWVGFHFGCAVCDCEAQFRV